MTEPVEMNSFEFCEVVRLIANTQSKSHQESARILRANPALVSQISKLKLDYIANVSKLISVKKNPIRTGK